MQISNMQMVFLFTHLMVHLHICTLEICACDLKHFGMSFLFKSSKH